MNKNELEFQRLVLKAKLFGRFFNLMETLIGTLGWVAAIYLIFQGLIEIAGARPESIIALSGFIEKLEISNILLTLATSGVSVAWYHERRGKKRAIRKLADMRRQLEKEDPYRSTSELDENGHTPKQ